MRKLNLLQLLHENSEWAALPTYPIQNNEKDDWGNGSLSMWTMRIKSHFFLFLPALGGTSRYSIIESEFQNHDMNAQIPFFYQTRSSLVLRNLNFTDQHEIFERNHAPCPSLR
ncbi:hypothetical protein EUGRSUZ_J00318 [Eucalyptus grandis]|uniref:Uncharacterized protein n=2 Tax=Eucalyptus grandis TaxID=71139 RepID=A0ACC3J466_EUCGR|nr:hypothetical protein EUGRSUZ_J00318 [Eucalyptus grandis]